MNHSVTAASPVMSPKARKWFLLLILGIYLLLALGFGIINPLFEAPDEHHHYFTVRTISESKTLPSAGEEPGKWMSQEAAQPPLYYVLGALIISPIDTSMAEDLIWFNPRVQLGDASSPTNINAFIHTPSEDWPWGGYVLSAHLLRLFSTFLGLGTLLFIYAGGRLIWPHAPERALLATALVAFLPQYVFLHGSITNDALVIFFSAAAIWQLLYIWFQGFDTPRLLLLGLTIGLAILSKMAGLLLLFYAAGLITALILRDNRQGELKSVLKIELRTLGLIIAPVLLLSGWLLWRNWTLYQDITATSVFVRFAGGDRQYTIKQVLFESVNLWSSLFAVFGWFNVRPPDWIYRIWDILILAAGLGTLIELIKERTSLKSTVKEFLKHPLSILNWPGFPAILLAIWFLLVYAGLFNFMLKTPAAQGRLLFPALIPMTLAVVYGLSRFRRTWVFIFAASLALVTTLYSLFDVLPGAYAQPDTISVEDIPNEATTFKLDMGQGLELVAAQVETEALKPGEFIWLTLYWQALPDQIGGTNEEAPEFVLEMFGRNNTPVGKLQSYHGGGLYPATLWPSGGIIGDRFAVKLSEDTIAPVQARLNLKTVGEDDSVDVGMVKVSPQVWPDLQAPALAQIEGVDLVKVDLASTDAHPGDPIPIDLSWRVSSPPGKNLTTFVHLGDPSSQPLAQADSPPLNGDYPTILWEAGEIIEDSYTLVIPNNLPAGRYPIHIGLYDPNTGARVPLVVDGNRQPFDAYLAGWVNVEE